MTCIDASRQMYEHLKRTLGADTVLLFQVNTDFYYAFWDDAPRLSEACGLRLGTRHMPPDGHEAPACGVLRMARNATIAQALRSGLRVAVVEEDGACA